MKSFEMTGIQKNIWNIQKLYPDTGICNIGGYLYLEGKEDPVKYQRAFEIFLQRQSTFWCKVNVQDQIYFDPVTFYKPEIKDLRGKTQEEVDDYIRSAMNEPFSMYDHYLFEIRILLLSDRTVAMAKTHHLILDGYGFALFVVGIEKVYEELDAGIEGVSQADIRLCKNMEHPVPVQPILFEEQKEQNLIHFNHPGRNIQAKERFESFLSYLNTQDGKEWNYLAIHKFCRKYRTSLEALVTTAIGGFFCKGRKEEGICIGRNLLNRRKEELDFVGLCVNTLPYIEIPCWESVISEILAEKKSQFSKQGTTEEGQISWQEQTRMELEISYRPFRYMPKPGYGECVEYKNSCLEIPMKIFLNDTGKDFIFQICYQETSFSDQEIESLTRHLFFILKQMLSNPERILKELVLCDDKDWAVMEAFNQVPDRNPEPLLPERFLKMAEQYPEKTALIDGDCRYTYREILEMVHQVINGIRESLPSSNRTGHRIGVCMERGVFLPAAIYGIWLSGNTYLPISIYESGERKQQIFEECQLVLTEKEMERILSKSYEQSAEVSTQKDVPAYAMYTSGTTGEAKAVLISHSSLAIRIDWMETVYGSSTEVILQKTRNTFDVSMWELSLPFAYGKTLCVLKEKSEYKPKDICTVIQKEQVTMLHFVPAMFREFVSYICKNETALPSLRQIILSGEAAEAGYVRKAMRHLPQAAVANLYGPTECTIDVSYYPCTGEESEIPIGRPVDNTKMYVIDEEGNPVIPGREGELVICGDLVGLGYLGAESSGGYRQRKNLSERTVYDTGDRAVLGWDGNLYYRGRKDQQVKIRGMRVSLAEVERELSTLLPEVSHHILYVQGKIIDVYCGESLLEQPNVRAARKLPYYCVPTEFCRISEIPTGKSGKADKKALKTWYLQEIRERQYHQKFSKDPEIGREEKICLTVAKNVLQRKDIRLEDDLFEKGMDSLNALVFVDECEQSGVEVTYDSIYLGRSIRRIVEEGFQERKLVWFQKKKEGGLLLMIPYAGGSGESFRKVIEELKKKDVFNTDALAVNPKAYANASIEEMAEDLCGILEKKNYEKVYILSTCVGSALAVELIRRMQSQVKGVLLAESLPYRGIQTKGGTGSFWDFCPKKVLIEILQLLRGRSFVYPDSMIAQFREDVRKSAAYLRHAKPLYPTCEITLLFGKQDLLTKGYQKKYKQWHQWLRGRFRILEIRNGKHFLAEEKPKKVAECIDYIFFQKK